MAIETDINQALLDDIYAIYSQAETEMLEKVAKRVAKGIKTEGWNEKKLSEVQELKKDIEKTIKTKCYEGQALISEDIISAYTKGKISATMDAGKKAKKTSSINMSGITSKKLKESIQTAFDYAKGMEGLPQDPDTLFKKVVYATGAMETKMIKQNAGAQVIGDTIYVCKPYQKYIDDEFIMHEIGHKATKFGNKTTDATQKKQAEELAKKLGYKDIKSMSLYISDYAAKNPTEFYPEALMEYYKSLKTGKPLMGNKKKIIEAAIEQMYNDPKKKKQIHEDVVKFATGVHSSVLDELDIPMNLKQLVLATNKLLNNASFQILRNAEDAYTQVMANATTGLLSGVDTRIQASQKMLNEMSAKGITSFVDKAGRSWSLSSYAEMCVRTVGAHAALQGHIDRQLEVGEDLVKVSTIGTTCPICQRWQGVVLSISGKSPKYHGLDEAKAAGLFHPNCKHTLGMYIPELDEGTVHEGKVEPEPINMKSKSSVRNDLIQQQRANERKIRYWKDRASVALSNEEKSKCLEKVKYWQHTNLLHCEKNGLRRQYAREKTYFGNANGPVGAPIGGHLKDYESLYKDVIGVDPKQVFKESKKIYGSKTVTFEKWLKDEIQSLDQLDIDKAQMKDANNKTVTPTSLYKKYIGDNPMQDWSDVAPYEKGTKEYKSGYAKWLKNQIDEIGVTYKIKPKYVEIHEDIPLEDTKLSATEIYKKYHNGDKPTDVWKSLGGEEGTGMKYAKWVETQKKELIKNGITKTVPFGNVTTQKTVDTISQASQTIADAKDTIKKDALDKYQKKLDSKVFGAYDGYLQVKEQMEIFKEKYDEVSSVEDEDLKFEAEKLKIAMKKHIEMVKKKAEKTYGGSSFEYDLNKLKDMLSKETDVTMKAHIQSQIDVYAKVSEQKAEEEEKKKKLADANEMLNDIKSGTFTYNYATIKKKIKENFDEKGVSAVYVEAYKFKKKASIFENLESGFEDFEEFEQQESDYLALYNEIKSENPGSYDELIAKVQYETIKEALSEFKAKKAKEEADAKKKAKLATESGKVTLGRETKFDEGKLVKRDDIYQKLDLIDLEKLSDQAKGHKLFENSNRRDILGRDRIDGHNHHRGHDVRIKSGLSKEDKELAEAFALAYDEYFNTIQCGPINKAYLMGYENASPSMKKKIDAMNKCIQSCELNEPIVLHRYVDKDLIEAIFHTDDVHSLRPGSLHENNTFMSTSAGGHPTFGKRDYMITLQCDKGTHALPSLNHEELEVLLGKGQLEVVRANKYTKKNPNKLKNYDGSYTEFVGDEVVVRYIEDGKAYRYEEVDADKIDAMLGKDELVKHHTKESKEWIDSLSTNEMTAQKRYTGSYYVDMNNVYRRNDRSDKSAVKWAEDLTAALRRSQTEQPVVLRRGVNERDLAYMLGFNGDFSKVETHWDEINKGGYAAEDKGFLSTSPYGEGKGGFSKAVDLRIYCPAGTHAAYVDSISSHRGEKETLLQSGSIFKVHKLKKEGHRTVAYIELLGTD